MQEVFQQRIAKAILYQMPAQQLVRSVDDCCLCGRNIVGVDSTTGVVQRSPFIPDASTTLVRSAGKFVKPAMVDKNSDSTDISGIVLLYRFKNN